MVKIDKKNKVTIIILTINSLQMVKGELEDISKLDINGFDLECVVVDNGSNDGSSQFFNNYNPNNISFKYIQNTSNLGFAGGNNVGIKYALDNGSDFCLLLNNDMILQKDLLTKLITFMKNNPQAGLVSPKIYFAKGYEFHKEKYESNELGKVIWYAGGKIDWDNIYTSHIGVDEVDIGQFNKSIQTEVGSGSCLLIRSKVFEKVGLLDERLFLYWEDADFSRRVIKKGFDIYYCADTAVWHKVSISAGGSGSSSNDYFLIRNRYFFANRYASLRAKIAVLRDTIKLAIFGREWQKKGALDALIGRKGIGSWKK